MNLVIDFGNTRIKAALFQNDVIYKEYAFNSLQELKEIDVDYDRLIISNVSYREKELKTLFPNALFISTLLKMPFSIDYATPHTLGVDRLALAAGGLSIHSDDLLIIDIGTCITYDLVENGKVYKGGAISPGAKLRAKSMHNFTHKLPLVEAMTACDLVGNSTEKSIMSGLVFGIVFEIEGFITKIRDDFPEIKVILSGGDAEFFETKINQSIFVVPNLALLGLNKILQENI